MGDLNAGLAEAGREISHGDGCELQPTPLRLFAEHQVCSERNRPVLVDARSRAGACSAGSDAEHLHALRSEKW